MPIRIKASFMQPLICATASAAMARLQPLLHDLHAAGGLHSGDVLVCADMHFRVAQRLWRGGQDALELEIVLQHEAWHCPATGRAAPDRAPACRTDF